MVSVKGNVFGVNFEGEKREGERDALLERPPFSRLLPGLCSYTFQHCAVAQLKDQSRKMVLNYPVLRCRLRYPVVFQESENSRRI